jgi:hypothetical protein
MGGGGTTGGAFEKPLEAGGDMTGNAFVGADKARKGAGETTVRDFVGEGTACEEVIDPQKSSSSIASAAFPSGAGGAMGDLDGTFGGDGDLKIGLGAKSSTSNDAGRFFVAAVNGADELATRPSNEANEVSAVFFDSEAAIVPLLLPSSPCVDISEKALNPG